MCKNHSQAMGVSAAASVRHKEIFSLSGIHSQALTGPIPRLSLVSFPSSHWPHSQALTGLIPRLSLASFPGSHWPHSQALTDLIPRLSLASFRGSHWPHSQAVGHGSGVQRDRNPWSCEDRKGYSPEDQYFLSISPKNSNY